MPLYQAVKLTALSDFGSKLKVCGFIFMNELFPEANEFARLATKMPRGGGGEVSFPSLQIGGSYTEVVEIKIQIGGAWKNLAS